MKNPILLLGRCYTAWRNLGEFPGVFSLPDASKQVRHVLQPRRVSERELKSYIRKELKVDPLTEGAHEIEVKRNGLVFYWMGTISGGLASGVLQEKDPAHPHYYTSPPIHMSPASLVLDVGACEGLFAFRLIKEREAACVICFEPSPRTASFLEKAARKNGVADRIGIEIC